MTFIKEACVENLNQAVKAEALGADRIELCDNLDLDGTTPPTDLIKAVVQNVSIPVRVMIRPRGGDFIYTHEELNIMQQQINSCKQLGVEGVVFGVLNPDNTLNIPVIKTLIAWATPLQVTIHKAIDDTPNIPEALNALQNLNKPVTVLTSGGKATAQEGKAILKQLVNMANLDTEILPAGKINAKNINSLHEYIGAKAYHGKRIVGTLG